METRECNDDGKASRELNVATQDYLSRVVSEDNDDCFPVLVDHQSSENGELRCESTNHNNEVETDLNNDLILSDGNKQRELPNITIKDLLEIESEAKLQELVDKVKADSLLCQRVDINHGRNSRSIGLPQVNHPTTASVNIGKRSATCGTNDEKTASISKNTQKLPVGPLTRSARKSFEAAIAKTFQDQTQHTRPTKVYILNSSDVFDFKTTKPENTSTSKDSSNKQQQLYSSTSEELQTGKTSSQSPSITPSATDVSGTLRTPEASRDIPCSVVSASYPILRSPGALSTITDPSSQTRRLSESTPTTPGASNDVDPEPITIDASPILSFSSTASPPCSQSSPTTDQCTISGHPTFSSTPQLASSLFYGSSSIFGSEDECRGNGSNPTEMQTADKNFPECLEELNKSNEFVDNCEIVSQLIAEAMEQSASSVIDSRRLHTIDDDTDWDMLDAGQTPENTDGTSLKLSVLGTTVPASQTHDSSKDLQKETLQRPKCLLISENKDDDLEAAIKDALQTTSVKTMTLEDVMCFFHSGFSFIWFRMDARTEDRMLTFVEFLRNNSSEKSKQIHLIAVVDDGLSQDKVDLYRQRFNDVYSLPLQATLVRQKYCGQTKATMASSKKTSDSNTLQPRVSTSPESFICLESDKSSDSDPKPKSMDGWDDIALLKCSPTMVLPKARIVYKNSPYEKSPPPTYCKAEHASKEKHRRERIKDSCDQLRKLLPYVRGRKTDMASILEMTVDYLNIVNAALPTKFQAKVIEMLSKDAPPLDCRSSGKDSTSTSGKRTSKLMDILTLGKSSQALPKRNMKKANNQGKDEKIFNCITNQSVAASQTYECDANMNPILNNGTCTKTGKTALPTEPSEPGDVFKKAKLDNNANAMDNHNTDVLVNENLKPVVGEEKKEAAVCAKQENSNGHVDQPIAQVLFPHMFTDGDRSANRMFSTGHLTGNKPFPALQRTATTLANSNLTRSGRAACRYMPGVLDESAENVVASVNSVYFDASYYYYPSYFDMSNGNYCVSTGTIGAASAAPGEYVNPNAVLPMTISDSATRIANFNLGRRYERLTVSETDRFSIADSTRGPDHQQQRWKMDL